MKQMLLALGLCALAAQASAADCYADYKAKRGNPLELHYGVVKLNGQCAAGPAKAEISARIAGDGWTILNVVSVFGLDGLDQRRGNAGTYFLRY